LHAEDDDLGQAGTLVRQGSRIEKAVRHGS
jgi:hypothetical protein